MPDKTKLKYLPQQNDWPNFTLTSQGNPTCISNCIPTSRCNATLGSRVRQRELIRERGSKVHLGQSSVLGESSQSQTMVH